MDIAIVAAYFAIMLAIGVYAYLKQRSSSPDAFFVADRRGTRLMIAGSLFATAIGASATVGLAGLGFTRGLSGAWWLLVATIGLLILSTFWAKRVRRFGVYTLPALVEKQYGREAGFVAAVLVVVSWVGLIAAQIAAAGKILGLLFPQSFTVLVVVSAAVFILYTLLGAQYSIIRTDFIQSFLLIGGVIAACIMTLSRAGWTDGLAAGLSPEHFSFPVSDKFSWSNLLTMLLLVGGTYVVGPDIYSRLLCARSEKVATSAARWAAIALIPVAFAIVLIGMGARVLFADVLTDPELAFPHVIQQILPVGLGGLVIAGLLAAIMSSADTCLLTTSTIMTEDIYKRIFKGVSQRRGVIISRVTMVAIGVVALVIALRVGSVIGSLLLAYTVFTSGVVLPVLAGFHRDKLRVNSWGALAAIVGGGGAALAVKLLHAPGLDLLGLGVCLVMLFGVSWLADAVVARSKRASRRLEFD